MNTWTGSRGTGDDGGDRGDRGGVGGRGGRGRIGESGAGSLREGLIAKLSMPNPEDLEVGYPAIVEGPAYDYFCLVENVYNEESDIANELAGSALSEAGALGAIAKPGVH